MRNTPNLRAEQGRIQTGPYGSTCHEGNNGVFRFKHKAATLTCMVSDEGGWDHVSVSVIGLHRTPTWAEMEFVREIFFHDDEWVIQYSPARKDKIDNAEVLHMWRPQGEELPKPPSAFV